MALSFYSVSKRRLFWISLLSLAAFGVHHEINSNICFLFLEALIKFNFSILWSYKKIAEPTNWKMGAIIAKLWVRGTKRIFMSSSPNHHKYHEQNNLALFVTTTAKESSAILASENLVCLETSPLRLPPYRAWSLVKVSNHWQHLSSENLWPCRKELPCHF